MNSDYACVRCIIWFMRDGIWNPINKDPPVQWQKSLPSELLFGPLTGDTCSTPGRLSLWRFAFACKCLWVWRFGWWKCSIYIDYLSHGKTVSYFTATFPGSFSYHIYKNEAYLAKLTMLGFLTRRSPVRISVSRVVWNADLSVVKYRTHLEKYRLKGPDYGSYIYIR